MINATGAWGGVVAGWFGDVLPLQVKYPTMLVTEPLTRQIGVSLGVEGGGFYARQVAHGNFAMNGGYGHALPGARSRPGPVALAELGRTALAILPVLTRASIIRCWSASKVTFPIRIPSLASARGCRGFCPLSASRAEDSKSRPPWARSLPTWLWIEAAFWWRIAFPRLDGRTQRYAETRTDARRRCLRVGHFINSLAGMGKNQSHRIHRDMHRRR